MAKTKVKPRFFVILACFIGIIAVLVWLISLIASGNKVKNKAADDFLSSDLFAVPTEGTAEEPEQDPEPTPYVPQELPEDLTVSPGADVKPSAMGVDTKLQVNRKDTDRYSRDERISFSKGEDYTAVPGLLTFGGNNYRNTFSYGVCSVTERRLVQLWAERVGQIDTWAGTGWTGQPLIVQWPENVRKWLGVAETYRSKENFTEVIYPAMDGNIYFFDLETGAMTRTIQIGKVMKCTACLDPNGYPVLYVGQSIADYKDNGLATAYVYVISLVKNELIYQFGKHDYFSYREWQAYDGSPLIAGDTIFYGGENGVLYSSKLHTSFNEETGEVSVSPEALVKYRYTTKAYSKSDAVSSKWYGIESSLAAFKEFLYFTDNGGLLQCVNANNYQLQFAVDIGDDADATPVLEEDPAAGTVYVYTASQVRRSSDGLGEGYGYTYHKKINALTGATVWTNRWVASSGDENSSGGTIATPHVGRGNISHLVIYATDLVSVFEDQQEGTDGYRLGGKIIAYNKANGQTVWSVEQEGDGDFWSSPVVVYDAEEKAFLLQCDRDGKLKLYDALTGTLYYTLDLGSRIDSTPAVFNNYLVVGTRGKGGNGDAAKIVCIRIS